MVDDAARVCQPGGAVNFSEPGAAGVWKAERSATVDRASACRSMRKS
jgi:hypothetical protein